jgi:hypothetical protein
VTAGGRRERVLVEQPGAEAGVGEVGQQRAVTELHELDRIVLAQPPGRHLATQEVDGRLEERPHVVGHRLLEPAAALDRLAAHDHDEVAMAREELEAGVDQRGHLIEALEARGDRLARRLRPVAHRLLDHRGVEPFLGPEVVEQRGVAELGAGGDVLQSRGGEPTLRELPSRLREDACRGRLHHLLTR